MGNNGFNGVETRGTVPGTGEVTWPVFADGSSYRLTGDLTVAGGLVLPEGTRLAFGVAAALEVQESGFLAAVGSAAQPVVFTAATPAADGYWGGIVVRSASDRNRLHHAEVSYVGGKDLPELPNARANVVVTNTGRLSLQQSVVTHGTGWGVVAYRDQGAQVNEDAVVVNQFSDLALGTVKLAAFSETTSLVGDWLDAWSFNQGNAFSDTFYDRATGGWFNGATTPWR